MKTPRETAVETMRGNHWQGKSEADLITHGIEAYLTERPWIKIIEAAIDGGELFWVTTKGTLSPNSFDLNDLSIADLISDRIRIKPEVANHVCEYSPEMENDSCKICGEVVPPSDKPKFDVDFINEPFASPDPLPWRQVTEEERKCLPMDAEERTFDGFGLEGMQLRDYFAAKSLDGLFIKSDYNDINDDGFLFHIAKRSYKMADIMMEARKPKEKQ
jgi:hypothetical protein